MNRSSGNLSVDQLRNGWTNMSRCTTCRTSVPPPASADPIIANCPSHRPGQLPFNRQGLVKLKVGPFDVCCSRLMLLGSNGLGVQAGRMGLGVEHFIQHGEVHWIIVELVHKVGLSCDQFLELCLACVLVWGGVECLLGVVVIVTQRFGDVRGWFLDRKSTRLNSSHVSISYAVFCL